MPAAPLAVLAATGGSAPAAPLVALAAVGAGAPAAAGAVLFGRELTPARLQAHVLNQIKERVAGLDPAAARLMWDGDPDLNTVTRNPDCWGHDLRSQLTGAVAWKTGYRQSAGGVAITRRHVLCCAHYGQNWVGTTLRFMGAEDGQYFETTISRQYPETGYMTYAGYLEDLEVWLTAEELPAWVNVFPLVMLPNYLLASLPTSVASTTNPDLLIPLVAISQGESNTTPEQTQKLYVNSSAFLNVYDTIRNIEPMSGLENYNKRHPDPAIHPYFYDVYTGDSGTPAFLLVAGILYLSHVVTGLNFGLQAVWSARHADFIDELIARVDAAHSITTGLTCTRATLPPI